MYKADIVVRTDDYRFQGSNKDNNYSLVRNSLNNLSDTSYQSSNADGAKLVEKKNNFSSNNSSWRKDEKSEKSVRDKIALFSNGDSVSSPKYQSNLAKSTECLDSSSGEPTLEQSSRKYSNSLNNYNNTLPKSSRIRCHSVEALDEVDQTMFDPISKPTDTGTTPYEAAYHSKFMIEKSKPVPLLEKAFSVENVHNSDIIPPPVNYSTLPRKFPATNPILSRHISLITNGEENKQRSSNVNLLLEQRKRSMSKLRGLVIPEKVPESETLAPASVIGMPIIKSKDCEKISNEILPQISQVKLPPTFVRRASVDTVPIVSSQQAKPYVPSYRAILNAVHADRKIGSSAPAKPPRTSLHRQSSENQPRSLTTDDSEDSDSVSSSKRLTPPISPIVSVDKERLTRTTSSETNISVTSSNSTLTTGSISSAGSQASCSSVSSTSVVDMSRKIQKNSSSSVNYNRKNILAMSKSRNGKEEKCETNDKRSEGDDSTEEESDIQKPKIKNRSLINISNNVDNKKEIINYRVAGPSDVVDIKTINIAQCVELIDSTDASIVATIEEKNTITEVRTGNSSPSMSDLAKWVRTEAAKTAGSNILDSCTREEATKTDRFEYIKKFTKVPVEKLEEPPKRDARFAEPKKLNLSEIRKTFEVKAANNIESSPATKSYTTTPTKEKINSHDRFSSWDSVASSSSGVSSMQTSSLIGNTTCSTQNLQSPPSDFGSFSSLGSSHSLITPQVSCQL